MMSFCIKQLMRFESAEFPFQAQLMKTLSNTEAELKKRVAYTVKHVYNGHLRLLKKLSAIIRCPLYRVLDLFGQKKTTSIMMADFFHTIRKNSVLQTYFKI